MSELTKENIEAMAIRAAEVLDSKKAEDIKIIDISGISIMADYFVIASGNNINQIQMMSDEVSSALNKEGFTMHQIEGYEKANWVLLDFGDVIVHIFDKESRQFYDLERIWRDGRFIDLAF